MTIWNDSAAFAGAGSLTAPIAHAKAGYTTYAGTAAFSVINADPRALSAVLAGTGRFGGYLIGPWRTAASLAGSGSLAGLAILTEAANAALGGAGIFAGSAIISFAPRAAAIATAPPKPPIPGGIPFVFPPPVAPATSTAYQIVPMTEAPAQSITITLGGQACLIVLYTKSTNVPMWNPDEIATDPNPVYENVNPCFVDLYTGAGATLIIGGVYLRQGSLIVRDTYLGFVGDMSIIDFSGAGEDPRGVPPILPPNYLRNYEQRQMFPLSLGNQAPPNLAGRIPGMGSRWLLTYWAPGTYTPGYPPSPPPFL